MVLIGVSLPVAVYHYKASDGLSPFGSFGTLLSCKPKIWQHRPGRSSIMMATERLHKAKRKLRIAQVKDSHPAIHVPQVGT
jgi:hypothetical protein